MHTYVYHVSCVLRRLQIASLVTMTAMTSSWYIPAINKQGDLITVIGDEPTTRHSPSSDFAYYDRYCRSVVSQSVCHSSWFVYCVQTAEDIDTTSAHASPLVDINPFLPKFCLDIDLRVGDILWNLRPNG